MPIMSDSWKASFPINEVGTWPPNAIIGTENDWEGEAIKQQNKGDKR